MNVDRKTKAGVRMLLACGALLLILPACARDHRLGASDINRNMASPIPHTGDEALRQMNAAGDTRIDNVPRAGATAGPTGAGETNVEISNRIAEQVAAMDEVKTANVLVAGNSAYVAVALEYGAATRNANDPAVNNTTMTDVSDQVKQTIVTKVKSLNPRIQNVYVSASPDFVERVNSYAQDIKNGRPVSGFFKEMGNIIQRLIPRSANNPTPGTNGQ